MSDYQDVLKRLATYRKRLGITQEQIGQRIGLSQEQYSYLENGKTKISSNNLQEFVRAGWNIDYLITGMEFEDNSAAELERIFAQFKDRGDRRFAMKIMAEVILEEGKKSAWKDRSKSAQMALLLLDAVIKMWEGFSMSLFVRKEIGLLQTEMAEKLGIGIKKYREIERELCFPDAELLLSFYTMSGYRPTLFMNFYDRRLMSMSMVWKFMMEKEKADAMEFLNLIKRIV